MYVIDAVNVNDAYRTGMTLLMNEGVLEETRNGPALVMPRPVTTVYERPWQRVLFDPKRDANPFFHIFESIWLLAGRRDAKWLDLFVKDFSSRFAENDGNMHGAYGYRWRNWFGDPADGETVDQLAVVIRRLKENSQDRRVVIQMWDAYADLDVEKLDLPCNLVITPRIVGGKLDITVFCRSNDAIWGVYGANAVHFSVLQEYLAAMIGVPIGTYYQCSNNFHAYTNVFYKLHARELTDLYRFGQAEHVPMVTVPEAFDMDLQEFMAWTDDFENTEDWPVCDNVWFTDTAAPLYACAWYYRRGDFANANGLLDPTGFNIASDWLLAAQAWLTRRQQAKEKA